MNLETFACPVCGVALELFKTQSGAIGRYFCSPCELGMGPAAFSSLAASARLAKDVTQIQTWMAKNEARTVVWRQRGGDLWYLLANDFINKQAVGMVAEVGSPDFALALSRLVDALGDQ